MRTLYKICATMSIIATMFIAVVAISIWSQKPIDFVSLNWGFILPALVVAGFLVVFGGAGVFTIATNKHVWKKLEELQADEDALRKERMNLMELKEKLLNKVLTSQEVCRYKA